jgi:hypothetical protein
MASPGIEPAARKSFVDKQKSSTRHKIYSKLEYPKIPVRRLDLRHTSVHEQLNARNKAAVVGG